MTSASLPRIASREAAGSTVELSAGPTPAVVSSMSRSRKEPEWMGRLRLRALDRLRSDGVPAWAGFLRDVDFDGIIDAQLDGSPPAVDAHDRSTVPGLGALAELEAAYQAVREDLAVRGVRFLGLRQALSTLPDLVKAHFASVVTADGHPLAALNSALWSSGSFLYVPPGVRVDLPLQAEIREDYANVEPFERNVIVADAGAEVTYIEGCTAPVYTPGQLHNSTIEVVARPGARVRYIALQNFSKKVDNLVTKHAHVHEGASLEWVDVNLGSRRSWKVPRTDLIGPGACVESVGMAFAGSGQHEDVGAEAVHLAPRTVSRVVNRGVVRSGGRASLRLNVRVAPGASRVSSSVDWSALMLDAESTVETVPTLEVDEADAAITQDGSVRKVGEEVLFYMASRGLTRDEALRMVVVGFAQPAMERIPVEYAVEVDRLIELELGSGIG